MRNKHNQLIKEAKRLYLHPRLNASLDKRTLWSNAKPLGLPKFRSSPSPAFTADEFNSHIANVEPSNGSHSDFIGRGLSENALHCEDTILTLKKILHLLAYHQIRINR